MGVDRCADLGPVSLHCCRWWWKLKLQLPTQDEKLKPTPCDDIISPSQKKWRWFVSILMVLRLFRKWVSSNYFCLLKLFFHSLACIRWGGSQDSSKGIETNVKHLMYLWVVQQQLPQSNITAHETEISEPKQIHFPSSHCPGVYRRSLRNGMCLWSSCPVSTHFSSSAELVP